MSQVKKTDIDSLDPYEALANAIVIMAVTDYRKALRSLRRNPGSKSAQTQANKLERFFRSEWYRHLTKVDGEMLIVKLREEH